MNPRFPVGTRVRIVRAVYADQQRFNGKEGVVTEVIPLGNSTNFYVVRVDTTGHSIRTREVEAIPEPEAPVLATDVVIDLKRAQAAKFAHDLLGNDVLLDDVLALAAFVAGEDGKVAPASLGTVYVDVQATPAPNLEADRDLVNADRYYDGLSVYRDRSHDNDLVNLGGAYLKEDGVRELITYLQALLRVNDVEGPNPAQPKNAPF